jgi:hypothetical protein
LLLKSFDLVPRLQSSSHNSKIKFFHENKLLIHVKKNVTSYFLILEDVAVSWINTKLAQILGRLRRGPCPNISFANSGFFLFICFIPRNIRQPMVTVVTVFTPGISLFLRNEAVAWSV